MSKPYVSVRHLESMELLPKKLIRGRIYFIDDDQLIVIDHGQGPVIYGGKPGPQGEGSQPDAFYQEQIDTLAGAVLTTQKTIYDIDQKERRDITNLTSTIEAVDESLTDSLNQVDEKFTGNIAALDRTITEHEEARLESESQIRAGLNESDSRHNEAERYITDNITNIEANLESTRDFLIGLTEKNAEAVTTLMTLIHKKFNDFDSALATLAKSISELYPETFREKHGTSTESDYADPLDGEVIETESGSWIVEQTTLADGTSVFELRAQALYIDTLDAGDTITFDGQDYTVTDYDKSDDGTITISLRQ